MKVSKSTEKQKVPEANRGEYLNDINPEFDRVAISYLEGIETERVEKTNPR
jgi:hypothetical protein